MKSFAGSLVCLMVEFVIAHEMARSRSFSFHLSSNQYLIALMRPIARIIGNSIDFANSKNLDIRIGSLNYYSVKNSFDYFELDCFQFTGSFDFAS